MDRKNNYPITCIQLNFHIWFPTEIRAMESKECCDSKTWFGSCLPTSNVGWECAILGSMDPSNANCGTCSRFYATVDSRLRWLIRDCEKTKSPEFWDGAVFSGLLSPTQLHCKFWRRSFWSLPDFWPNRDRWRFPGEFPEAKKEYRQCDGGIWTSKIREFPKANPKLTSLDFFKWIFWKFETMFHSEKFITSNKQLATYMGH